MIYPKEDSEQETFVNWFRMNYQKWIIFAIPNGGNRDKIEGAKLKKTGTLAGVPDLIVLMDSKMLFIEMKKRDGKLSKAQKELIPKINNLGFDVIVAYGFMDAKEQFLKYISKF